MTFIPAKAIKVPGSSSGMFGIFRKLRLLLVYVVFSIILINAVIISIDEKDPSGGVKYIGEKFLKVTYTLSVESNRIIDHGGIYDDSRGFFRGVWEFIKTIWAFVEAFYILYVWIKILTYISIKWILWDDSKRSVGNALALLFFFGIQMITLSQFTIQSMWTPFTAFWDFARALPYVISPISDIAEKFTDSIDLHNLTKNITK